MKKTHFSARNSRRPCVAVGLTAQKPTLTIDVNHPTAKVSQMLYGLMTEEINYSYDGGIYGELVRDRAVGRGFGAVVALADGGQGQLRGARIAGRDDGPKHRSAAQHQGERGDGERSCACRT